MAAAMRLSPPGEFEQGWAQGLAIRGKSVLGAKDGSGENASLHQSVSFQLAQLSGEYLLGGFRNATPQLTEAAGFILEFAKDQRLPFAGYNPESNRHWALMTQHAKQNTRCAN